MENIAKLLKPKKERKVAKKQVQKIYWYVSSSLSDAIENDILRIIINSEMEKGNIPDSTIRINKTISVREDTKFNISLYQEITEDIFKNICSKIYDTYGTQKPNCIFLTDNNTEKSYLYKVCPMPSKIKVSFIEDD